MLKTTTAKIAMFAALFASVTAISVFVADVDEFVDAQVMTEEEHITDMLTQKVQLKEIASDTRVDRIVRILVAQCEDLGSFSLVTENGTSTLENKLKQYEEEHGRPFPVGLCYEGERLREAQARKRGLIQ